MARYRTTYASLSENTGVRVSTWCMTLGLATLNSRKFEEPSTQWKFRDLLTSAAAGKDDRIFDSKVEDRAERLNQIRNRIHVGKLLAEVGPAPIPDTRPEEAAEAIETCRIVIRSVLDWLGKHPDKS